MGLGNLVLNKLTGLGMKNLRTISSKCFGGSSFSSCVDKLDDLKKLGIKRIVDFRAEATLDFAEACKGKGFEYLNFPISSTTKSTRKGFSCVVDDDFFANLKKYISMVNKGDTYVGCQFGLDRTNVAVMLNYLLNPKAPVPKIMSWGQYDKKNVINNLLNTVRRKFIKKLTPEQIKELGLPADYNPYLQKRIAELLKENVYNFVS